jgi:low temperature requirement protein LtrA
MSARPAIHLRMRARDTAEPHRASSPLEALYDLVFVVAVGSLVAQVAVAIEHGDVVAKIVPFLFVFFAIWWAWINFTWFSSAYDTDDVVYRLLTILQMAGALVLAAGVPAAVGGDYRAVVVGYVIMRVGQIALWVRAAVEDPASRGTTLRYAGGAAAVQVLWALRLLLADEPALQIGSFIVLAVLEMLVPVWAERAHPMAWHPHHIAERYALFLLILLGESVLAAVTGLHAALEAHGVTAALVVVAVAGLVLLVAIWWAYFLQPAGSGLERHRRYGFFWGYGHSLLFAALAAIGAALEAAVQAGVHPEEGEVLTAGLALAIPTAVALVLVWGLHAPMLERSGYPAAAAIPAAVLVLIAGGLAEVVGLVPAVTTIAVVAAGSVALAVAIGRRRAGVASLGA